MGSVKQITNKSLCKINLRKIKRLKVNIFNTENFHSNMLESTSLDLLYLKHQQCPVNVGNCRAV